MKGTIDSVDFYLGEIIPSGSFSEVWIHSPSFVIDKIATIVLKLYSLKKHCPFIFCFHPLFRVGGIACVIHTVCVTLTRGKIWKKRKKNVKSERRMWNILGVHSSRRNEAKDDKSLVTPRLACAIIRSLTFSSPDTGNNTEISVVDCTQASSSSTRNIRG